LDDWHLDASGRYDQYDYSGISIYDAGLDSREPDAFKKAFNPKLALSWKTLSVADAQFCRHRLHAARSGHAVFPADAA
jgi:hypothetical protein